MENLNLTLNRRVEELICSIKEDPTYQNYLRAKEQMMHNEEVMQKIKDIKSLQKKIVLLKSKKQSWKQEEEKIDKLLKELNQIPIYKEYSYLQEDLNETLQQIKFCIENVLNKEE